MHHALADQRLAHASRREVSMAGLLVTSQESLPQSRRSWCGTVCVVGVTRVAPEIVGACREVTLRV